MFFYFIIRRIKIILQGISFISNIIEFILNFCNYLCKKSITLSLFVIPSVKFLFVCINRSISCLIGMKFSSRSEIWFLLFSHSLEIASRSRPISLILFSYFLFNFSFSLGKLLISLSLSSKCFLMSLI